MHVYVDFLIVDGCSYEFSIVNACLCKFLIVDGCSYKFSIVNACSYLGIESLEQIR